MTNRITYLGAICLLVGVGVLVAPTYGFYSLSADRGFGAETAADERAALLGLETTYDGTEIRNYRFIGGGTSAEAIDVTNNAGSSFSRIDATVETISGVADDTLRVANGNELDGGLSEDGATTPVELECSGFESASGPADVAVGIDAHGSRIDVEKRTYTVRDVSFNCQASGGSAPPDGEPVPIGEDPSFERAGSPTADGGTVTFQIENDGADATVTEMSVRETSSSDATEVNDEQFGNEIAIEVDGTAEGSVDRQAWEAVDIGEAAYSLDDGATIRESGVATITLDSFRTESSFLTFGDEVEMGGESITVVFYFEDRDPLTVTFQPDG